ncbi:DUF7534 family protein [Halobellus rubicundus]|uniref:Uncharacterized protein n=1 Tax=Halobellus rubicundus TaxID=2996466 RepID=A0ABD5MBY1_9EURY
MSGEDASGGDRPDGPEADGASAAGSDGGFERGVAHHFLRFVSVVLAVDALGLGVWWLLPPEASIRTVVLVGTLIVAPLLGFLLVYAPTVSRSRARS